MSVTTARLHRKQKHKQFNEKPCAMRICRPSAGHSAFTSVGALLCSHSLSLPRPTRSDIYSQRLGSQLIQTSAMDQKEEMKIHSCRIIQGPPAGRKTSRLSAKQGTPGDSVEHIYVFPVRDGYSAALVSVPERCSVPSVCALLNTVRMYKGIVPALFVPPIFFFFHLLVNFCGLFCVLRWNFVLFFLFYFVVFCWMPPGNSFNSWRTRNCFLYTYFL